MLVGQYLFSTGREAERFLEGPEQADQSVSRLMARVPGCQLERGSIRSVSADVRSLSAPIFIVSAARSGSTLLFETLEKSDQLWSLGTEANGIIEGIPTLNPAKRFFESHRLTELDATAATIRTLRAALMAGLRDSHGRPWLDMGVSERPATVRMLEKSPENAYRIKFLLEAFPDANFIYLIRDPVSNISSIVDAWSHQGFLNIPSLPGWQRGDWNLPLPPGWEGFNQESMTRVAAHQWATANEAIAGTLTSLPSERWKVVNYSSLASRPRDTLERLCAHFNLEVSPSLSQLLSRPLPLSATTITRPSPLKWRYNRRLDVDDLAAIRPTINLVKQLEALAV